MSEYCRGFLLINRFLNLTKFSEIYEYLKDAAKRTGIELSVYTNDEFVFDSQIHRALEEYDFCIFWDKDISLAKRFEKAGIRCYNSASAIDISDDKWLSYTAFTDNEIATPETVCIPFTFENIGYTDNSFLDVISDNFSYPYVIKERRGSFGAQVYLATDREAAERILKSTGARKAIAQRFVKEASGTDIRINMVGDEAVASMQRYNESDFRANITNGGSMKKYTPTEEEIELSRRAMKAVGLDFGGVDILHTVGGPVVCEINSNAHFKNILDCTGINVADAIMRYVLNDKRN